jgi:hypothetical protein
MLDLQFKDIFCASLEAFHYIHLSLFLGTFPYINLKKWLIASVIVKLIFY